MFRKTKNSQAEKPKKSHPPVAEMVDNVVQSFGSKGCSLVIIKNTIREQYSLNMKYYNNNIKIYIKKSLQSGYYVQKSGKGLTGKFKIFKKSKSSKSPKEKVMLVNAKSSA